MADKGELDDELRSLGRQRDLGPADELTFARVAAAMFGEHLELPKARIGRFELVRLLGQGGMGSVFEARDPSLQRTVAIKVLKTGVGSSGRRRRMLAAEARALARLAHDNVVRIYEIGEHEEGLFVVMELVVGTDLRGWLHTTARTRAEILACHIRAGRGLAAAHRVGLVHRDFKPGNVLVGDDGTVRVADFGLASSVDDGEDEDEITVISGDVPDPSRASSSGPMGTPGYMAPEQIALAPPDAYADQFSFCVTLYEALTGVLPFKPAHLIEMSAGDASPAPVAGWSGMPRWLSRILRRGLSSHPSARWPSLDALVEALVEAPKRRRRLALAAVVVVAVATGWALFQRLTRPSCDATSELAEVWTTQRGDELAAGAPHSPSFAAPALELARTQLDDYGSRWRDAYAASCEATWIAGTRTPQSLETSIACLDAARRDMATAIEILDDGRAETIARAGDVLARLPDPKSCERPTAGAAATDRDRELERVTGRARIIQASGHPREALDELDGLGLGDVDIGPRAALAWLARSESLTELARYDDAESALLTAARIAASADDDRARLQVLRVLARFYGSALPDLGRSQLIAAMLEGLGQRVDLSPADRASLEDVEASVAAMHGDLQTAIDRARDAVATVEGSGAADPQLLAAQRKRLGEALQAAGRHDDARATYRRASDDLSGAIGESHPGVATIAAALGSLALEEGKLDEARLHYEDALEVYRRAYGDESVALAIPLTVLAQVAVYARDFRTAEPMAARAWTLQQQLPVGHPDRGSALAVLAVAHAELGDYPTALAEHEQVLRELGRRLGGPERAAIRLNTGWLLCRVGRCREARELLERVVIDSGDEILRINAGATLAEVELAESRPFAALERTERLLAMDEVRNTTNPTLEADLRATLALALAETGAPPRRVRTTASEAVTELEAIGRDDNRLARLRQLARRD